MNEEDGLLFRVLQEISGARHLQLLWNGEPLEDVANLVNHLKLSRLWPVYQLRALVLVQQRVEDQLHQLLMSEDACTAAETVSDSNDIGKQPFFVTSKLRGLERRLLEKAIEVFESQVSKFH